MRHPGKPNENDEKKRVCLSKSVEISTLFWYNRTMENKRVDLAAMPRKNLEEYALQTATEAEALRRKVEFYEEQIRLMRQKRFGKKSEASPDEGWQTSLFNEAEDSADESRPEKELARIKPPKQKKAKEKGAKDKLLKDLPRQVTEYALSEEDARCPRCGQPLHEMKKIIRRELEVIPARVFVREHVQHVYSCRNCEKNDTSVPILKAPAPAPLLNGGVLSPSLAAFVLCRKYDNRDTLYKMERDFKSQGLRLDRQDLSNWVLRVAECYGEPLYDAMRRELLSRSCLCADETPVQVLREPRRSASQKSYMWLFCGQEDRPVALYKYADNRSGEVPRTFLKGFKGILQTDGYGGYNGLSDVLRVGCFAHVRRKFVDAAGASKGGQARLAAKGADLCDGLFKLDALVKAAPEEKRLARKEELVRDEMTAFFEWAGQALPQAREDSLLWKALSYSLNQREYLENYFADGRVEISNNLAERSIRPFVMGRKCWLFCDTPRGARASAIWYSVVVTAKENKLDPFRYIEYFLDQMRRREIGSGPFPEDLLPWSREIQDKCGAVSAMRTTDS